MGNLLVSVDDTTFQMPAPVRDGLLDFLPPGTRDDFNNLKVGSTPGSGIVEPGAADNHGNTLVGGGQDGANENLITGKQMLRTIVGGYKNVIGANLASGIIASQRSTISGTANHANIFGGSLHNITGGAYTTIVGGSGCTADGDFAITIGGNTVSATGVGAVTIGGSNSVASGAQAYSMGANSKAVGNRSAVVGGQYNEAHGAESFAGGHTSKTYGMASIAFGYQGLVGTSGNPSWGDYSASVGGFQNKIGQVGSARYSGIVGGRENEAGREYVGIVGGRGALGRHTGAAVHAMGYFATQGDAQTYRLMARREMEGPSALGIYLDDGFGSPTHRLVVPANTAWMFEARVVARCPATGESAAYKVVGGIKRGATSADTVLVGTPTVTTVGEDVAAWNVSVAADTANGALALDGVGETGKLIRWVATVDVTEVVA